MSDYEDMKIISNLKPSEIQREIAQFSFFSEFSSDRLASLAQVFKVHAFDAGETILQQGQENQALYFLRDGHLEILVDSQPVSFLESPGEILGEMSFINKGPVMASVRALSQVSVFVVTEYDLGNLPQQDQVEFKNLMNQVLNQVLVRRLDRTNDRAKRFEATNKELQITQKNLKELNQTLENEISRRSRELVDKVKNISETHLSITAKQMNQALQQSQLSANGDQFREWSTTISEAVELLKPVIDLSEKQGSAVFRRVYLCAGNKKQQSIAKLALGGTGVVLEVFSSGEELIPALENALVDLILIDAEMADSIAEIKLKWPLLPLVVMLGQDLASYLDLMKRFPTHPFFVARNPENRALTIKSLTTTVAKILNKDIFGLEKYLSWGAHVVEAKVRCSHNRLNEIEKMKEHFRSFGVRSTFLDQAHTVADEMLMNAIYDAPTDTAGKPIYNHFSRLHQVDLTEDQSATLRYGTDGVFLAVSVTDPFGSLTKNALQSYLQKNYLGQDTGSAEKGGAGKGLYMIITTSDFVVFNVKPQKRTEVICFFQLERTQNEESQPTFHLFF